MGATVGLWKILCKKPCFDIKKREKLHLDFLGTAGWSFVAERLPGSRVHAGLRHAHGGKNEPKCPRLSCR